MQRIDHMGAAKRGRDRQGEALGEALQRRACRLRPAAAAEERDRPGGRPDELLQPAHVGLPRPGLHRREGRRILDRDRLRQHVLRQRDHHRAGAAAGRDIEGARDELGDAGRVVDLGRPFRDRAENRPVVELLEGLALTHVAGDLADEQDHRGRILARHMHSGRRIGGAGAAGDEADAGRPGGLAGRLRHHGGAALLPADRHGDRPIMHGVERRDVALARNAKDVAHAVQHELVDQDLGGSSGAVIGAHGISLYRLAPRRTNGRRRRHLSASPDMVNRLVMARCKRRKRRETGHLGGCSCAPEGAMNREPDTQEPVLALLGDPATYLADAKNGGQAVKRIDTHAASVFLAGARALKIKRAVEFPFLDFSTLAKRKAACAAELEVNRPFAPQIYRRVVAITRQADGALALDGGGEPVEWAVEMRRFDEAATLDHLADQGRIDTALADTLGRIVAAAHAQAPPVEPRPWIDAIGDYIAEHEAEFGKTPELFPPAAVAALGRASRAAYERIRPLLVERGRRGLIRRIHGDLHLGNIALIEDAPVLFDAIEFSPLIGSGDVLYDLAFLLMDLIERGLPQPANVAFNRYLAQTRRAEDLDALAALPFYLSMRAAIRAKVTAERRERAAPAERAEIGASAQRYFDLAAARDRAAAGGPARDRRALRHRQIGARPHARGATGADAGRRGAALGRGAQGAVRQGGEREASAASLCGGRNAPSLCGDRRPGAPGAAAGHSVILDAVFARPTERLLAEASAAVPGVRFHGLFLEAPLATRIARVGGRSRDASDADAAVARAQESYDLGALTWTRIDASEAPEDTLRGAQARLS